jgi:hypothetical protein
MGSIKKVVKKIAKPKVLLPLALIAATGGLGAGAIGAKGAAAGAGAGGGLGGLFSSIFGGGAGAAGSGGLGSFLTSKKFLLPQLISAGTQLATTGKIDPKQQLLAAALSGVGGLGQGATAAEKAALAQRTAGMSAAEAAKLQAGYAGMSRDAAAALAQGANPFASTAAQEAAKGIGYGTGLVDPALAQAAGMGTAAAQTAGTMSALPAINPTLAAQANPAAFQTFLESAPLSQRLGQTAANLTRGLGQGLANPLSKKGLMSYGALGTAGMLLNEMGKPKTEAQKNLGVDAQAQYDLTREMNRMMGGAYTDEQLNAITAPMLSQYGGEYETITGPRRKRRPMFPGLNYSGLTRYAADGGTIVGDDDLTRELFSEMMGAQMSDNEPDVETLQGIKDYIDYLGEMDQAEKALREEVPNPIGRAEGGAVSNMTDMINQNIDQMQEGLTQQMQGGFTTQEAIVPVNAQAPSMASPTPTLQSQASPSNFALAQRMMAQRTTRPGFQQNFTNRTPVTIGNRQGNIGQLRSLMGYADGGSIPQTPMMPQGMQLDGRGGGFIPMGAQEKKDDVPAMLAKNEFVMTSDAVRAAGGGDINKGAQKMYDLMNSLESKV